MHVPTFIVGAEYDLFQRSEPLLYRGINLPSSQKKLLFGPWYHGSPTAHLTADDGSKPIIDRQGNLVPSVNNLALAWYDHWLKGFDNGIDRFPTTETYQLGRGAWNAVVALPISAERSAAAVRWIVSPSGTRPRLGRPHRSMVAHRQFRRTRPR